MQFKHFVFALAFQSVSLLGCQAKTEPYSRAPGSEESAPAVPDAFTGMNHPLLFSTPPALCEETGGKVVASADQKGYACQCDDPLLAYSGWSASCVRRNLSATELVIGSWRSDQLETRVLASMNDANFVRPNESVPQFLPTLLGERVDLRFFSGIYMFRSTPERPADFDPEIWQMFLADRLDPAQVLRHMLDFAHFSKNPNHSRLPFQEGVLGEPGKIFYLNKLKNESIEALLDPARRDLETNQRMAAQFQDARYSVLLQRVFADEAFYNLDEPTVALPAKQIRSVDRRHCQGLCTVERTYTEGPLSAVRQLAYYGGVVGEERILLRESENAPPRYVILVSPSGTANLILSLRNELVSDLSSNDLNLVTSVQVFDRNGVELTDQPVRFPLLESKSWVDKQLGFSKDGTKINDTPVAVVCESGFGKILARDPEFYNYLIKPVSSGAPGISNLVDAAKILPDPGNFASEHAEKVSRLIFQNQWTLLYPVGADCLSTVDQWLPHYQHRVPRKGAIVVNASVLTRQDQESCAQSDVAQALRSTQKTVLWVLAAGNDAIDVDAARGPWDHSKDAYACPQQLGREDRKNMIVVAAGTDYGLSDLSNRGQGIADIAASSVENGSSTGYTSFAAPRVTQVAARIAAKYPELTPEQIRKVILLSAVPPTLRGSPRFQPTLSGGILSSKAADLLAAQLKRNQGDFCRAYKSYLSTNFKEVAAREFYQLVNVRSASKALIARFKNNGLLEQSCQ